MLRQGQALRTSPGPSARPARPSAPAAPRRGAAARASWLDAATSGGALDPAQLGPKLSLAATDAAQAAAHGLDAATAALPPTAVDAARRAPELLSDAAAALQDAGGEAHWGLGLARAWAQRAADGEAATALESVARAATAAAGVARELAAALAAAARRASGLELPQFAASDAALRGSALLEDAVRALAAARNALPPLSGLPQVPRLETLAAAGATRRATDLLEQSSRALAAARGALPPLSELPGDLEAAAARRAAGLLDEAARAVAAAQSAVPALSWSDLEPMREASFVGGYSSTPIAALVAAAVALAAATGGRAGGAPSSSAPLPAEYDVGAIARYYALRPVSTLQRAVEIARHAAFFGAGLLADVVTGAVDENAPARAATLLRAIEQLGPAWIKLAQALSTRVDLLSPSYLAALQELQDNVPRFSDEEAWRSIRALYGGSIENGLATLSPSPVAAASLGQVYRGVLRPELGGHAVAVKVRRPRLLERVALDLFLMRSAAAAIAKLPGVTTDFSPLLDEWAARFFEELDYRREARNQTRFAEDIVKHGLEAGIVVPRVHACAEDVLVTEWIEGEKLSESSAGDVLALCTTLLNSYLIQLLDTGFLHADPHPGNLLRTTDGRVAILDFGLMTQVPPNYSIALVQYIAHLTTADWGAVAGDLVALGFVPPGAPDPRASGLAEPLGVILSQLAAGGGAANIDIEGVLAELDGLTRSYPYFQTPAYFVLILRTFSVIEGIALRADPAYSIVGSVVPYLARRLLSDNDPVMQAALRDVLFGGGEHIDVERIELLLGGLKDFSVDGLRQEGDAERPILGDTAQLMLKSVFSREGTYVQDLLVDEAAAAVDAVARDAASTLIAALLGSAPALAGASAMQALGPLRPLLLPLPTPSEVLRSLAPLVEPSARDRDALVAAQRLAALVGDQLPALPRADAAAAADALRLGRELVGLAPELAPGLARTATLFAQRIADRATARAVRAAAEGPAADAYVAPTDF
jgi:aarF domain-containing kinase